MAQYVFTMNGVGKVVPPKREILRDIYLSFFPGAKIGVLGLNGAGKSTLLRIMAGIDTDIIGEARPQPGIKIGYLSQEPDLDDSKDVRGNVEEALGNIPRVRLVSYNTLTVDLARRERAQVIVRGLRVFSDFELEFRMALTNKRLVPDIEVVCLITSEEHTFLSSSTVKEVASLGGDVSGMVPPHVAEALKVRFSELGEDGPNSVPVISLRD